MKPARTWASEYKVGDYVSVIRHTHGWHDGGISGRIVRFEDKRAVISVQEDSSLSRCGGDSALPYEVICEHPRDVRPAQPSRA